MEDHILFGIVEGHVWDNATVSLEALHVNDKTPSTTDIKRVFDALDIKLTPSSVDRFQHAVIQFELRGDHPLTLQSQIIGAHPIIFTSNDRAQLFSAFHTNEQHVKEATRKIPFINQDFEVSSDPFNLFAIWLIHLAYEQIKDQKKRHYFQMAVAKYLHYRFFTSLIRNNLKYGADPAVMLAVMNSLSRKFDIITKGTWYNTIADRCEDLLFEGKDPHNPKRKPSIHIKALQEGVDDKAFVYALTDTQTRIRDKIVNICSVYYDYHSRGIKINSSSATTTDSEGEKILIEKASTFDSMIAGITTDLMSVNAFIDYHAVQSVVGEFPELKKSPQLLKFALEQMSIRASSQVANNKFDDVIKDQHGDEVIVGMRKLIRGIIETSYRYCIRNGIPLNSKVKIWNAIRNAFTASRTSDDEILLMRRSMSAFVDTLGKTREATKSSLRIACVMYVILRSFKYL